MTSFLRNVIATMIALPFLGSAVYASSFKDSCEEVKNGNNAEAQFTLNVLLDAIKQSTCDDADSLLSEIEGIDLSAKGIKDLSILRTLRHLKHLNLQSNNLSSIEDLAYLTKLTSLNISDNHIKNLDALAALTALEKLDASQNQISNLESLNHLHNLRELYLQNNLINNLKLSEAFAQLRYLDLSSNVGINDVSGICSAPRLSHLDISYTSTFKFEGIAQCRQLKHLKARDLNITDTTVLKSLTKLTDLDLAENLIESIAFVGDNSRIQRLSLNNNYLSSIDELSKLTYLSSLDISNNIVVDLAPLSSSMNLQYVSLGDNPVSEWQVLCSLPKLQNLLLPGIRNLDTEDLKQCSKLVELDISKNYVKDLTFLSKLPNLISLKANANYIEAIPRFCETNSDLAHIEVNQNFLTQVDTLSGCNNLESISLEDNYIRNIDALANLRVENLNIAKNPIRLFPSEGFQRIQSLDISQLKLRSALNFRNMTSLSTLNLFNTQVPEIQGLATLTNLEHLNADQLSTNNDFELKGVLQKSHKLQSLNLGRTTLSQQDLNLSSKRLLRSLTLNQTFQKLSSLELSGMVGLRELSLSGIELNLSENSPLAEGLEELHGQNLKIIGNASIRTSKLRRLSIERSTWSTDDNFELPTTIEWLSLRGSIPSPDLSNLSQLQNLQLDRANGKIFSDLGNTSSLRKLSIAKITDQGFSANSVLEHENLNVLSLAQAQSLFDNIGALEKLKELSLHNNGITDLKPLAENRFLQLLTLSANQISDISPLSSIGRLQVLNLDLNKNLSDVSSLRSAKRLKGLAIQHTQVSNLSALENSTLQKLYATDTPLKLAKLSKLEALIVDRTKQSDLRLASHLEHLRLLSSRQNNILNTANIKPLRYLQILSLQGNTDMQNADDIKALNYLRYVDFKQTRLKVCPIDETEGQVCHF